MRTKTNIFLTILRPECGAEAPQYGRLLSLCAEDAPQVSNDVYNQRYTSEKLESRYKQSGRSMIEMLGVLAIIGVLTVGSITGYSKAMRRHLLNKQREQISYILSAVETNHDKININTPNLPDNPTSVLKTFGWIPEEMIKDDTSYIYDTFKNKISCYKWSSHMGLVTFIASPNAYEQCTNLYQTIQQYHAFLTSTSVIKKINQKASYWNQYHGDQYQQCINNPKACIRNLTPANISQLCQVCKDTEDNYCVLYILWK